jgi:xylulokinase
MRRELMSTNTSYEKMNQLAAEIPPGSEGLMVYPFGNGAERLLENKNPGASFFGLNLNLHNRKHLIRATQEGIVFSMIYGLEVMQEMGLNTQYIRAGNANMFLSNIFKTSFCNLSNAELKLYNTNGALGAARGAGIGIGYYQSPEEAFNNLEVLEHIEPLEDPALFAAYRQWKAGLNKMINQ